MSRWPIDGSIYQWSPRLRGYGWFAAWVYTWTLVITIAAVAYGAASFLALLLGIADHSNTTLAFLSLGLLAFSTLASTIARAVLETIVVVSTVTSVLASVATATVFLLFYRENLLWSSSTPSVAAQQTLVHSRREMSSRVPASRRGS
jgi:amino acid transporter